MSPIAETQTTKSVPSARRLQTRSATLLKSSSVASELPPYFCTTRGEWVLIRVKPVYALLVSMWTPRLEISRTIALPSICAFRAFSDIS